MQRKYIVLVAVTFAVFALDQLTKFIVVDALTARTDGLDGAAKLGAFYSRPDQPTASGLYFRPTSSTEVIPDFLRLRYAENPGAAFSLFRDLPPHIRAPLFHVVSILAVILIVSFYRKLEGGRQERWLLWGLPLLLGGTLGNYADRIARGFVVDFIEAHWRDQARWPSFNIADMAICIGVGMVMVDAITRREKVSKDARPA